MKMLQDLGMDPLGGIVILAYALISAGVFAIRYKKTYEIEGKKGYEAWRPLVAPLGLSVCGLMMLVFYTLDHFLSNGINDHTAFYVDGVINMLFWSVCYFSMMAIAVPLLRKCFAARTCALIWLLPNFLTFWAYRYAFSVRQRPIFVLPLRLYGNGKVLLWVWLCGAVTLTAFQWIGHFRFRRKLMKHAEAAEGEALNIWNQVQENCRDEHEVDFKPLKLYISTAARTPVSVGLFRRTMRVVLPPRPYSHEELEMVFRHELIHIYRKDAQTKLLLGAVASFMWFNPLMWLSKRRCAEDIELCCDEYALYGMEEQTRLDYAELLLSNAGDERGFSTCLSASARAMRYRLTSILKPISKASGWLWIGAFIFLIVASFGTLTVGYSPCSLQSAASGYDANQITKPRENSYFDVSLEQIMASEDLLSAIDQHTVRETYLPEPKINFGDGALAEKRSFISASDVWLWLKDREVYRIIGWYQGLSGENADVLLELPADDEDIMIIIEGRYIMVTVYDYPSKKTKDERLYWFSEKPNWEELAQEVYSLPVEAQAERTNQ